MCAAALHPHTRRKLLQVRLFGSCLKLELNLRFQAELKQLEMLNHQKHLTLRIPRPQANQRILSRLQVMPQQVDRLRLSLAHRVGLLCVLLRCLIVLRGMLGLHLFLLHPAMSLLLCAGRALLQNLFPPAMRQDCNRVGALRAGRRCGLLSLSLINRRI
ncbi:Uncharacterised protein [uncultured archaeon]|nr:Uncharacterised protein [uncultured archaeon]